MTIFKGSLLNSINVEGGRESQGDQVGSWVTVITVIRELARVHRKKRLVMCLSTQKMYQVGCRYSTWVANPKVAALEVPSTSNSWESSPSNRDNEVNAAKA